MKYILYKLFDHQNLSSDESRETLIRMSRGEYNDHQIAAFITVYLMRSITTDELAGFRNALLEMRVPVNLSEYGAIDIVGTGGDNKNTFNISTAACFTVAGAGYKVVKHGNYGSTSICGASNLVEQCGVKFTSDVNVMRRSLDKCGIAYLHAPLFNRALKTVANVRKNLAVRTFFNMLGPLASPAMPGRQMLGVYNLKLARMYHYLYQQTDVDFTIVNSLDGYDEISLTAEFKTFSRHHSEAIYTPEELGFTRAQQNELHGGQNIADAAAIFHRILAGTATQVQKNAVIINAAFAIRTIMPQMSIAEAVSEAREALDSGKVKEVFYEFVRINS
ncbi:MAG: anthranilate phosphoribosyltransferase [Bacteroidales bacterium]|jgi:anthranilate phosphoribosyltransferase|nr:anthranilate phosphoribosyltransferase [Bacteroidales bacterium]